MFRSGKGGAGSVSFRREKSVPKGGPDGGDGGRGGHIILKGNAQLWTLLHLKYRKHIYAGTGEGGMGARCHGKDGEDVIVEVPLGTVARDPETGETLFEITQDGEEKILMRGGRGGLGNDHFKTATLQAPRFAQPGEEGVEGWRILELKVLADVGLVGFPNAGKSTLLSVISAAKPEIGDYPFTTLVPQLGIVPYHDHKSFIMADIPGIIEGASEGKGLGLRFLRHIERNSLLLFLIPADADDYRKQYDILCNELARFNPDLVNKDRLVAVSKCDLLDEELKTALRNEYPELNFLFFSSQTGEGIPQLKDAIWKKLTKNK
ncbi:MAG: GTPase ObgE [Flavobacteriales bacterium]|nr:GTPase ObgE [Flavobacteriales bacterium]